MDDQHRPDLQKLRGFALGVALLLAVLAGVTPAFAGEYVQRDLGGPTQSTQPQTETVSPPSQSPNNRDKPCHFGPFTMQVDRIEAARIAQAAPSGREALEKILALEENPELPPFTFLVATEDDGGDDITCN